MPAETRQKLSEILSKMALLTAACEGNLHHEYTITNEAIFNIAVEIQSALIDLSE